LSPGATVLRNSSGITGSTLLLVAALPRRGGRLVERLS
jgi:hypothetical protein